MIEPNKYKIMAHQNTKLMRIFIRIVPTINRIMVLFIFDCCSCSVVPTFFSFSFSIYYSSIISSALLPSTVWPTLALALIANRQHFSIFFMTSGTIFLIYPKAPFSRMDFMDAPYLNQILHQIYILTPSSTYLM